jgi:hypothetical protein
MKRLPTPFCLFSRLLAISLVCVGGCKQARVLKAQAAQYGAAYNRARRAMGLPELPPSWPLYSSMA